MHTLRTAKRLQDLQEIGGEDRNRTYLATCAATTVLKTARATRHPSLSQRKKMLKAERPICNAEFFARGARFGLRWSATGWIRRGELDAAFETATRKAALK